jgi:hypothetical protein
MLLQLLKPPATKIRICADKCRPANTTAAATSSPPVTATPEAVPPAASPTAAPPPGRRLLQGNATAANVTYGVVVLSGPNSGDILSKNITKMALFDLARMGVKLQVEGESDVKGTHLVIKNVAIWSPSFIMKNLMNTTFKNAVTMGPHSELCFANSYALPASFDCLACSFHLCLQFLLVHGTKVSHIQGSSFNGGDEACQALDPSHVGMLA